MIREARIGFLKRDTHLSSLLETARVFRGSFRVWGFSLRPGRSLLMRAGDPPAPVRQAVVFAVSPHRGLNPLGDSLAGEADLLV